MFGKARIEADATATKTPAQSGAMMLLKSIGFDPKEFMDTIQNARAEYETAKQASVQTVFHFNNRLDALEARLAITEDLSKLLVQIKTNQDVLLGYVKSGLKVTTQPDETQPDETKTDGPEGGAVYGGF
jgi:hypothetical protein